MYTKDKSAFLSCYMRLYLYHNVINNASFISLKSTKYAPYIWANVHQHLFHI